MRRANHVRNQREPVRELGAVLPHAVQPKPVDPLDIGRDLDVGQGIGVAGEPLRLAKFTNAGTEPLIISGAKGSCGCTVPNWPKDPIMPGESSQIEIRYDTKRVGGINKTVTVSSNDPAGPHIIKVIGTINAVAQEEGLPEKESIFKKPN